LPSVVSKEKKHLFLPLAVILFLSCRNLSRLEEHTTVLNPPPNSNLLESSLMSKVCPNNFTAAYSNKGCVLFQVGDYANLLGILGVMVVYTFCMFVWSSKTTLKQCVWSDLNFSLVKKKIQTSLVYLPLSQSNYHNLRQRKTERPGLYVWTKPFISVRL